MSEATAQSDGSPGQRLDKWLWAARFFKTRSLAAEAIAGGKIHLAGQRVKPARLIRPGDRLEIRKGEVTWEIVVRALNKQRRPASEATQLYEETLESSQRRSREARERRERGVEHAPGAGRPTKRDRRTLARIKGR